MNRYELEIITSAGEIRTFNFKSRLDIPTNIGLNTRWRNRLHERIKLKWADSVKNTIIIKVFWNGVEHKQRLKYNPTKERFGRWTVVTDNALERLVLNNDLKVLRDRKRPVGLYALNGGLIEVYESINACARAHNCSNSPVTYALADPKRKFRKKYRLRYEITTHIDTRPYHSYFVGQQVSHVIPGEYFTKKENE